MLSQLSETGAEAQEDRRLRAPRLRRWIVAGAVAPALLGAVAMVALPRTGEEGAGPNRSAGGTAPPVGRTGPLGPPDEVVPLPPGEAFAVVEAVACGRGVRVRGTCSPLGAVRVLVDGHPATIAPSGDAFEILLRDAGATVTAVAEGLDGSRAEASAPVVSAERSAPKPRSARGYVEGETVRAKTLRLALDPYGQLDVELPRIENLLPVGSSELVLYRAPPGLTYLRRTAKGHHTFLRDADGQEMVLVPGGLAFRGRGEKPPNGPQHVVWTRPFLIDRTEVTNAQYEEFLAFMRRMNDVAVRHAEDPGASLRPAGWIGDTAPEGTEALPVTGVNWYAASAYARWVGGRLPTEGEWERACAGPRGWSFPWGEDERPERLRAGAGAPAPADSFPAGEGPFSLLHGSGNVREWCSDRFEPRWYARCSRIDPQGSPTGNHRVVRGGSFRSAPEALRLQHRDHADPKSAADDLGFRVVRDWIE